MEQIPIQPPGTSVVPPPVSAKKIELLLKIISIVVALGIVSGGAFLTTRIWDPVWSPFRPSPEKVIAAMFEKMQTVKSSNSKIKLDIGIKSDEPLKASLVFSINGDMGDPDSPKSEASFNISALGKSEDAFSLKGDLKTIGTDVYFNLSEIKTPNLELLFATMGVDFNNIKGSWVKFSPEDKLGEGAMKSPEIKALTEQMQKIIANSKVYIVKQQLPDQTIERQKMYHYLVALDNEKTAKLIGDLTAEAMKQSNSNQPGQEIGVGAVLDASAIKGIISEFLNKIGEISVELLIGKKDNLLYSFKLEKVVLDLTRFNKNQKGMIGINLEINNSKFNQPVKVEAPAEYKNFEEVFPPLADSLFPVFDSGPIKIKNLSSLRSSRTLALEQSSVWD